MITVRWSASELIPHSFLNLGETMTTEKHVQQIDEIHEKLRHVHPAVVNRRPVLLHNNARPHVAHPTLQN